MIRIENVDEWMGHDVVDAEGEKLGKLDELYYPVDGAEPVLLSIKSGVLGRSTTLVPVKGITASRSHLRVNRRKADLADAPSAPGPDLGAQDVKAVEGFYGVRLAGERATGDSVTGDSVTGDSFTGDSATGVSATGLEGTAARAERARAAEEARARADALEQQAADRGATAKVATRRAEDAAADAARAQHEHADAEERAAAARIDVAREEARPDAV